MQTIIIDGNTIEYYKKEELSEIKFSDGKAFYAETYRIAERMCAQLNIECPDIGIVNTFLSVDSNGQLNSMGGYTYTPKDVPTLNKTLVIMPTDHSDEREYIGTLAHELRHIWQNKFEPDLNKKSANGFTESLLHPAEIDADGYGIWYISSSFGISIDEAAEILCPEEKKYYRSAYDLRIEKALEIKNYFDELIAKIRGNSIAKKSNRSNFLDKLKGIFHT